MTNTKRIVICLDGTWQRLAESKVRTRQHAPCYFVDTAARIASQSGPFGIMNRHVPSLLSAHS